MKNRLDYIDSIKGVAIFLMVMGHVLAWCFADFSDVMYNGSYSAIFWSRVIYAFHMPLFFCVSGYLYCKDCMFPTDGGKMIWKRFRTLIVPFLCVGILFHFTTGAPITKYWFLRTLFVVTSIHVVYDLLRTKYNLGLISDILFYSLSFVVLFVAGKLLKGTIVDIVFDVSRFASFNYFGFCIGVIIKRYDRIRCLFENNWTYSVCLGLFILLLFPVPVPKSIRAFLMCISGIVCVWYLMKYVFVEGIVVRVLRKFGRHSLDIYLAHFFLNISIWELGTYFVRLAESDTYFPVLSGCMLQLLYGVIISLFICLVCLFIAKIVSTSRIFSVLLFGKL